MKFLSIEEIRELFSVALFLFGAFKSTPEGRKRRAAIRFQKAISKHRKQRLKYIKEIRRDWSKGELTRKDYHDLLADYDADYPAPITP